MDIFGKINICMLLSKHKIVSLFKRVLKAIDTLSCVYTCKVVLIYHICLWNSHHYIIWAQVLWKVHKSIFHTSHMLSWRHIIYKPFKRLCYQQFTCLLSRWSPSPFHLISILLFKQVSWFLNFVQMAADVEWEMEWIKSDAVRRADEPLRLVLLLVTIDLMQPLFMIFEFIRAKWLRLPHQIIKIRESDWKCSLKYIAFGSRSWPFCSSCLLVARMYTYICSYPELVQQSFFPIFLKTVEKQQQSL